MVCQNKPEGTVHGHWTGWQECLARGGGGALARRAWRRTLSFLTMVVDISICRSKVPIVSIPSSDKFRWEVLEEIVRDPRAIGIATLLCGKDLVSIHLGGRSLIVVHVNIFTIVNVAGQVCIDMEHKGVVSSGVGSPTVEIGLMATACTSVACGLLGLVIISNSGSLQKTNIGLEDHQGGTRVVGNTWLCQWSGLNKAWGHQQVQPSTWRFLTWSNGRSLGSLIMDSRVCICSRPIGGVAGGGAMPM